MSSQNQDGKKRKHNFSSASHCLKSKKQDSLASHKDKRKSNNEVEND